MTQIRLEDIMFRNYLTIVFRNMLRYKAASAINILGLAVGIACCILIFLYIQDELNHDRFHEKGNRIYRVLRENVGGEINPRVDLFTSGALGPALKQEFSEVEQTVRILGLTAKVWVRYKDKTFDHIFKTVDANFFDVFSFPLIRGDRATALQEPYTVVISESAAKQYFGDGDPIGKTVTCEDQFFEGDYRVTGIMEDMPANASIRIDMLTSTVSRHFRHVWEGWWGVSTWRPVQTFVLLKTGQSAKAFQAKMQTLLDRHLYPADANKLAYHLQPLHRIYLYSDRDYGIAQDLWMAVYGDINRVYLFGTIAALILLIACANYINLTTARSANRAKEVGVRQVVGAHRTQLVGQFLSESILMAFLALLLAISFSEFFLPPLNTFMGKQLSLSAAFPGVVFILFGAALLIGFLAGIYPALFLSAFKPVHVMKGVTGAGSKGNWLRKSLVVFQFAITIILIVGTAAVYRQLAYIQNKRLGYNPELLITMPIFGMDRNIQTDASKRLAFRYQMVKEAFLEHPNVLKATAFRWDMGPEGGGGLNTVRADGRDWQMRIQEADEDFLDTYGIEIVKGRGFRSEDLGGERKFILNETAVKLLGWDDPVGKSLNWRSDTGQVIGVMRDYHDRSLRERIAPTAMVFKTSLFWSLSVRITGHNISETHTFLEDKWKQFMPNRPFTYSFVDDNVAKMYQTEMKLGTLASVSSGLAIFVACLGLLGLVSYTAEQRTKEIGIRKILGASVAGIILLIVRDFAGLILLANVIAWPVAYYLIMNWTQNFAYHAGLNFQSFILGSLLSMIIALATITYQALKAARANPIDSLRYE